MPAMLLNRRNLGAAKKALQTRLSETRSAHLTEAIAAGLGFRTHAALLARVVAEEGRHDLLVDIDEVAFRTRLNELGASDMDIAMLGEVSADVPDRCFNEFSGNDRTSESAHFVACRHAGRPMVHLKYGARYVDLHWDCITINPAGEGYLFGPDNGAGFAKAMFARFRSLAQGSPGRAEFLGSAFTGSVKNLHKPIARALAGDYFKMLYLPLRDMPR
jgi:hypothetical protein